MRSICLTIICLYSCILSAFSIDQWQNIRFSGLDANSKLYMRTEINENNLTENQILYKNGNQISAMDLNLISITNSSYQAHVNAGSGRVYYGLKRRVGDDPAEIVPVRYTGSGLPAPGLLTKVSDSPVNNNIANHCDIIAEYVTLTDTKLIVGLQNRGGGFPLSDSFLGPFYSYMVGVGDPELTDPYAPGAVAWALHYVNVLGVYSSGLYKITGTSLSDITRVAAIQSNIDTATNTLVMSCDLSTLLNDPDWQAFYNPNNPRVGFLSLINKISGTTATQMDFSGGGFVNFSPLYVDTGNEYMGSVGNLSMINSGSSLTFQAEYQRADKRFNWGGMSMRTESGTIYNMSTIDPETSLTRIYKTSNLKLSHPEVDLMGARAWLETAPSSYMQSDWYYYSYVRKLNSPQAMQIQVADGSIQLSWDAVNTTANGVPITVDRYQIEFASDPEAEFQSLGFCSSNTFQTSIANVGAYGFFRVTAIKEVP